MRIKKAQSEAEILVCFEAMSQLRSHLAKDEFLERVLRQQSEGYELAYLDSGLDAEGNHKGDPAQVQCVAGYRYLQNLAYGRILYVDDLVTSGSARSKGLGKAMLDWLKEEAAAQDCDYLQLDSGLQRTDAHRFYRREGLSETAYRFSFRIKSSPS